VVSGIAMSRFGENALEVIHNLKAKVDRDLRGPARGRVDPGRLRPLGPDPPRHRHAQATLIEESLIVARSASCS
jgi:Cu(I)/Ag(I) efflux system membrane protein CusA/SilA